MLAVRNEFQFRARGESRAGDLRALTQREADEEAQLGDDLSNITVDLTPQEQMQVIHKLHKVNSNLRMKIYFSEKRLVDFTFAFGMDAGQVTNLDKVLKINIGQSVKIEELRGEVLERNDIIGTCSKHIDALELQLAEMRRLDVTVRTERSDHFVSASLASATAAGVLRDLEDLHLDNSALIERAAAAEATLMTLRASTASIEVELAGSRGEARTSLQRSMAAVASQQTAEDDISSLHAQLALAREGEAGALRAVEAALTAQRAAEHASDEARADREVALAREAAVREELRGRESLAAGSLEAKVNTMMNAEARRREDHTSVLAEGRALAARADNAESARLRAEVELEQVRARCNSEVEAAAAAAVRSVEEAESRARRAVEDAEATAARSSRSSMGSADDMVARARRDADDARTRAEQEIALVERRALVDLAEVRQRAEASAEAAVCGALEGAEERVAAAVAARESADSIGRSLRQELEEARAAQAEAEITAAAAAATSAGEREASLAVRIAAAEYEARRDAFDAGAARQISELMETAMTAEATRDEALAELESATEALHRERRRAEDAEAGRLEAGAGPKSKPPRIQGEGGSATDTLAAEVADLRAQLVSAWEREETLGGELERASATAAGLRASLAELAAAAAAAAATAAGAHPGAVEAVAAAAWAAVAEGEPSDGTSALGSARRSAEALEDAIAAFAENAWLAGFAMMPREQERVEEIAAARREFGGRDDEGEDGVWSSSWPSARVACATASLSRVLSEAAAIHEDLRAHLAAAERSSARNAEEAMRLQSAVDGVELSSSSLAAITTANPLAYAGVGGAMFASPSLFASPSPAGAGRIAEISDDDDAWRENVSLKRRIAELEGEVEAEARRARGVEVTSAELDSASAGAEDVALLRQRVAELEEEVTATRRGAALLEVEVTTAAATAKKTRVMAEHERKAAAERFGEVKVWVPAFAVLPANRHFSQIRPVDFWWRPWAPSASSRRLSLSFCALRHPCEAMPDVLV